MFSPDGTLISASAAPHCGAHTKQWGGDVAQSVERRTGTPLAQIRFPWQREICLPVSTFSVDSLTASVHPRVQSHALTSFLYHVSQSRALFLPPASHIQLTQDKLN